MAPGILLAGGRSSRMGHNKAFAKLGSLSLVSRVLRVLHEICSPVILVTNTPEEYRDMDAVVLSDEKPYLGPLGGLLTGMRYAQASRVLVCPCDTPFLKVELLRFLVEYSTMKDAVLPVVGGSCQPLLAVYSGIVLSAIEGQLGTEDCSMKGFLSRISVQEIGEDEILLYDPDLVSFLNVNSPDDLLAAMKTLQTLEAGNE